MSIGRRMILGVDNLCYMKGQLKADQRKWPPRAKPPISARDWKTLRTAKRVETKAKKIATTAGFTCRTRK